MFADVRAFTSLAAGDNSIETWAEERSVAGLAGNIPMVLLCACASCAWLRESGGDSLCFCIRRHCRSVMHMHVQGS